jgi:hypothetical protein
VTGRALPRPLADDGVVHNDTWSRTVTVRPAPHASGRVKLLWRDAVRAQAAVAMPPPVWANGAGAHHIAFGLPTDDGALEPRFHRGQPAYARLVSTPNA